MARVVTATIMRMQLRKPTSVLFGAAFAALAMTAFGAGISTASAAACVPSPNQHISYQSIVVSGSTALGQLTNNSGSCTYSVGLAAYKTYVQFNGSNAHEYIYTQTLHDDDIRTLAPGQSVTLQVSVPNCNYQLDLFEGSYSPVPPDFAILTGTHTLFTWNQRHDLGVCGGQTPPITADIKANGSDGPITIPYAAAANISWSSQNATSCTITPGNWGGTAGSHSSGPLTSSRTYNLNCTGPSGSASDNVTIYVDQQPPQPISADIKANGSDGPITIQADTAAQISWSSQNAASCAISPSGWTGTTGMMLSENLISSRTYTVNCTGPSGSATDSVVVNVQAAPQPPTVDIKANGSDTPITIPHNTAATITWSSTNATTCTISPNGWTGTFGSQSSGNLTYSRTYNLNCSGPGGSVSDQVTVNITQPNLPTVDLNAYPRNINQGQTSLLSWSSTNADSCSASGGWSGGKSTYGSESVNPYLTTTYTITCVNQYGLAQDTDTVTVYNNPVTNPTNLQVAKNSLNRTTNQLIYSNFIEAQGQDTLEFEIRVRNVDSSGGSVTVRDILPVELVYVFGSTRVNGVTVADGITSGGISIGYLSPNEEKVIRLQATVLPGTSARTVNNQASATMNSGLQTVFATIQVKSRGQVLGAADIVTGPDNVVPWILFAGLLGSIVMYVMLFGRSDHEDTPESVRTFGRIDPYVPAKPQTEFDRMVSEIRAREKRPDTGKAKFKRLGS